MNDQLRYDILNCTRCPLSESRTLAVPAEAGVDYQPGGLGILAEAPGAQENATGRPMVGKAGQLLNKLLDAAGLSRDEVVILNRIRCRPPNNRMGSREGQAALTACDPWLKAELEAYAPSVVVVMGGTAMTPVFGATAKVTGTRGTVRQTGDEYAYRRRTWVATAHPAALLYPGGKVWESLIVEDLKLARSLV